MKEQTRRNFLKICGGTLAGAIISPLPWKLLDDVSIWTQNWSWIGTPPRGPVTWRTTTCTLCPAACGLKVRCIGGSPVSAWGIAGHPVSRGMVCPAGIGSPQTRFHPSRIQGAVQRIAGSGPGGDWRLTGMDDAVAEVGLRLRRLRDGGALDRVGLLDLRPGRSLSILHHEFLDRIGGGRYLTLPGGRDLAATTLGEMLADPGIVPGYDFARARTVISFGAPLLDGWSGPGSAPGLEDRPSGLPYLIQVESHGSPTANRADRWLPIRPGTEAAMALGLAHVLIAQGMVGRSALARASDLEPDGGPGYLDLLDSFGPGRVAEVTGCSPRTLRSVADRLAKVRPAVAVGGGDPGGGPLGREEEAAIWGLNVLLGAIGPQGCVTLRHGLDHVFGDSAPETALRDIPDGSLDLLIVDGANPGAALPGGLIRRKLSGSGALQVGLSPFVDGPTATADIILPVPAPGEWVTDVPSFALAAHNSYSLGAALTAPPRCSRHPADLLDDLASAAGAAVPGTSGFHRHEALMQGRIESLLARGRGEIFDPATGRSTPVGQFASAAAAGRLLTKGGCWTEETSEDAPAGGIRLLGPERELAASFAAVAGGRVSGRSAGDRGFPLVLMPHGRLESTAGGVLPPAMNKLYRESHVQADPGCAHLNPATAAKQGLRDGRPAVLSTPHGELPVTVVFDESVRPGTVRVAVGPGPGSLGDPGDDGRDVLTVCAADSSPVWRLTPAAIREV